MVVDHDGSGRQPFGHVKGGSEILGEDARLEGERQRDRRLSVA
jgi:hypothetical protein